MSDDKWAALVDYASDAIQGDHPRAEGVTIACRLTSNTRDEFVGWAANLYGIILPGYWGTVYDDAPCKKTAGDRWRSPGHDGALAAAQLACKRGLPYAKGAQILREIIGNPEIAEQYVKDLYS